MACELLNRPGEQTISALHGHGNEQGIDVTQCGPETGSAPGTTDEQGAAAPAARRELSLSEAESVWASLWDQDVNSWERYWVPAFIVFARDLVSGASLSPGGVALDIGTSSGVAAFEARRAVRSGGFVVGIDRCAPMIALARKKASRAGLRNVRFFQTFAEDLRFPEGFFDAVISNCGIPIVGLSGILKGILRVVRPGGKLAFNDWHLIDVKPHRIFGNVLGRYRTPNPSPELARERSALAKLESYHHSLSSEVQRQAVSDAGFRDVAVISHQHKVRLKSVDFYLKMRTTRATIRRELSEMSPDSRKGFAIELRNSLRQFRTRGGFVFDWPVFYISAEKPR